MAANTDNVLLDTNIIISAIGFGGIPRKILSLVLEKRICAVSSPVLLAELEDVIAKKFPFLVSELNTIQRQIKRKFMLVVPKKSLHVVKDEADNRVLEAAVEGNCRYIITRDKELLALETFRKVKIVTSGQFLKIVENY